MRRMMIRASLVVFLLLGAALISTCLDDGDLRIAAFNIQNFGEKKVGNGNILDILVKVFD